MITLFLQAQTQVSLLAQTAQQEASQYGGQLSGELGAAFVRMLLVLGVMVLLLGLLAWAVRRARGIKAMPAARKGRAIQVIERVQVDARNAVCLVRVAGEYFVFGTGERGLTKLIERPLDRNAVEAALGDATTDAKPAFLKLLRGDESDTQRQGQAQRQNQPQRQAQEKPSA